MNSFLRRSSLPAPNAKSASPFTHLDRSGHLTPHRSGSTELASPLLRTSSSVSSILNAAQPAALSHSGDMHFSSSMAQDSPVRRQPQTPPVPPSQVEPLTRDAVRRFEQQQKHDEETLFGRSVLESTLRDDPRTPGQGQPSPSRVTDAKDGDPLWHSHGEQSMEDSDDEAVYNSRIARQVREFLDSIRGENFVHHPPPVDSIADTANDEADVDEGAVQLWRRLERMPTLEVRRAAAKAEQELLYALYDAITLETDLAEMDEDAAVLERAVGQREETVELLRLQLSHVDEYNEELHEAKKEALRRLSESKTEMALLSQRNAKLSQQVVAKDEELQQALLDKRNAMADAAAAAAAAAAQRAAPLPPPRRDVGTDAMPELLSVSAAPGDIGDDEASRSPSSLKSTQRQQQHQRREVEAMHRKLELARECLQATERAKTDVELQSQWRTASVRGLTGVEAAETDLMLRRRCEESDRHAASLEEELRALRSELTACEVRRLADHPPATSPTQASLDDSLRSGDAHRSQAVTSSSFTRPTNTSIAMTAAGAHAALLHRQLERAQAEAHRLQTALHAEREKAQRQSAVEKKLLDNVTYLTRRLRDREATERQARSQRRIEQSVVRGEATATENEGGCSAPASTAPTESRRLSYFAHRASRLDGATTQAAPGTVTELSDGDSSLPPSANRYSGAARTTSPELRRRRDSVFAALRGAQRSSDERCTGSAQEDSTQAFTTSAVSEASPRRAAPLNMASTSSIKHIDAAAADGRSASPSPTLLHLRSTAAVNDAACTHGAKVLDRSADDSGPPVRSTSPLAGRRHTAGGAVSPRSCCSCSHESLPPVDQP